MEKPITVSFRWTREEMLRASRRATKQTPAVWRLYLVMRVVALGMLVTGTYSFSTGHTNLSGFIIMVGLSTFFMAIPFLQRLAVLRTYRQMPVRDRLVTWEITADRLTAKTELATSEMTWPALIKVIRLSDGFLLSLHPRSFHWLPSDAFDDPADIERLAELAKSKVQRYEQAR
jgi:YcxB-like protein